MAEKDDKLKKKKPVEPDIEETEEEIEEVEEEIEEPAPKPIKKARKIDIMDSGDSAEPPKRKSASFDNKIDFSPVIESITKLGLELKETKKEKKTKEPEKTESRGFADYLGDW